MNSMSVSNAAEKKHVVIVGGGFAGVHCAQTLAREPGFRITLIDRNNYQQFQPLLYQVAIGSLTPNNAAFNLRGVVQDLPNVAVKMSEIVSVNLKSKTLSGKAGDSHQGDYIVLAAGAEANFFDIAGVKEHCFPMYSLLDAERLRSGLIEVLEAADRKAEPLTTSLSFVVVGGGATGVETAGALADMLRGMPSNTYVDLDLTRAVVTLVDSGPRVLPPFSEKSQHYAHRILEQRGVKLLMSRSVKSVDGANVLLDDGTDLPANLVVWAGGLKASALSGSVGLEVGHGGRIDVQQDLQVAGHPGVYAIGDFANFRDDAGKMLPQLASVAQQAGRHCAKNIAASATGSAQTPFKYLDKGIMAMIGRNAAVAEVGGEHHSLTGPLAFAAWLGVHALLLTTLRAKVETFLEWAWDYFGTVRVDPILDRPSQPLSDR